MLKLFVFSFNSYATDQPPSGGCVLKRDIGWDDTKIVDQPPSGGCVLKPQLVSNLEAAKNSRLQAAVC